MSDPSSVYRSRKPQDMIALLDKWRHSGFNVFCGPRIQPGDEDAMENLARYIIRASFSQERMTYIPEESKVVYKSKDAKDEKTFDALEWIAAMPACACRTQTGAPMCRIRENRWPDTMDTTVTYPGASGKKGTAMN